MKYHNLARGIVSSKGSLKKIEEGLPCEIWPLAEVQLPKRQCSDTGLASVDGRISVDRNVLGDLPSEQLALSSASPIWPKINHSHCLVLVTVVNNDGRILSKDRGKPHP